MSSAPASLSYNNPKVLIVGAGPSGLILALSLLKNGVSVRIIEKTLTPRIGQRGAGLTICPPRTMEVFDFLSVVDEVARIAIPVPPYRMYKMPEGREVLKEFQMSPDVPVPFDIPYINLRTLGQDKLDKIFRTEMLKYGCNVEFGVELRTFEQVDNAVKVKLHDHKNGADAEDQDATYQYVIGADGGRSVVRKGLNLSFLGETTQENFIIGDLKVEGLPFDRWNVFGDMGNISMFFRPTENEGVMNILLGGARLENHAEIIATPDNLQAFVKRQTGNRDDIKLGEIIVLSHYWTNIRMTDTFSKGNVLIVGGKSNSPKILNLPHRCVDAAHIHSPTGGQGMNTGIQDAFNLGWKLSLVLKGLAYPSLLDTFTEERLPVVREMLNLTTDILNQTVATSSVEAVWQRGDALKQLGVNYRWSSIIMDEERKSTRTHQGPDVKPGSSYNVKPGSVVQAGDRAPDIAGLVRLGGGPESTDNSIRLFKLLSPARHTTLIFADKLSSADLQTGLSILERCPPELVHVIVIAAAGKGSSIVPGVTAVDTFEGHDGNGYRSYDGPAGKSAFFVIRFDGVVGARAGSAEVLSDYFQRIFVQAV